MKKILAIGLGGAMLSFGAGYAANPITSVTVHHIPTAANQIVDVELTATGMGYRVQLFVMHNGQRVDVGGLHDCAAGQACPVTIGTAGIPQGFIITAHGEPVVRQ